MKALEELKAALAAAHDELSDALEDEDAGNDEVRDAAIEACAAMERMHNTLPALIECAEVLAEVRSESGWNSDTWDRAHAALAKLENNNA